LYRVLYGYLQQLYISILTIIGPRMIIKIISLSLHNNHYKKHDYFQL